MSYRILLIVVLLFALSGAFSFPASAAVPARPLAEWVYFDETHASVVFNEGGWSTTYDASMYGGSAEGVAEAGAYVDFTFVGTSVRWIYPTAPGLGLANIYIDSVSQGTVDTYSASIVYQVYSEWSGLSYGEHVLRVQHNGSFYVDAFQVDIICNWFLFFFAIAVGLYIVGYRVSLEIHRLLDEERPASENGVSRPTDKELPM